MRTSFFFLVLFCCVAVGLVAAGCGKESDSRKEVTPEKIAPVPSPTVAKSARELRMKVDLDALPADDLPAAVKMIREAQQWADRKDALARPAPGDATDMLPYMTLKMNDAVLEETFALGRGFMLKSQRAAGNFGYMYDWLKKEWVPGDSQVRQAGSLWGLALCHRHRPNDQTEAALQKGFSFWLDQTIEGPVPGTLLVRYGNDPKVSTGTVALVALAIVEYLKTDTPIPAARRQMLTEKLEGFLKYLVWTQRDNGLFADSYTPATKTRSSGSSPYYDGETLLCLCKAARQLGYDFLVPVIEKAARATANTYLVQAWKARKDMTLTKGFYQWGSMSFLEYFLAGWKEADLYADVTLTLGWWMMHVHETLDRGRNHAYAVEGLVSAYAIAKERGDILAMTDLLYVIDRSLYKLTAWQIGGPLVHANPFLSAHPTDDPAAIGGIMNAARAWPGRPRHPGDTQHELRIDVTQHQMHAVILAMEHVYGVR
ncbi:hypothetical protein [Desulfosudis oleivorans]|uniref:Uncharacterized protein n=1 Tax=Desulfosudis oleivorans (strain DSM 6200 / JCM 39069 / Hxd3) TaxID=96561 RepID=A8ZW97_DESOH|nr:hypothetical protein [Desulfosudis oleivorans]ABW68331.1 hypothetical protein Dole_2527 [Desulfosudis oleivorans Hxd3]